LTICRPALCAFRETTSKLRMRRTKTSMPISNYLE
jgi:hypothetical protein